MKKLALTITAALLCFSFSSMKAQSANDNSLEGRARGAAHECLKDYNGPQYEITSTTTVTGICFVSGFITTVTLYAGPACHGPGPCPAFPTVPVATVTFGCGGELIGVTCL